MPTLEPKSEVVQFTSEEFQKWLRICLYHIGAFLMSKGAINGEVWSLISGVLLNSGMAGWTLYASRISNKINDLLGTKAIEIIVTKSPEISNQIESNKVISVQDVQDATIKTDTSLVKVLPK